MNVVEANRKRLTPGGMAPDLMAKHRICTSEVAPSSVSWAVMVNLRVTELCVTVKLSILTMPAAAAAHSGAP